MQPSSSPPTNLLCSYECLVHYRRENFLQPVTTIEPRRVNKFWAHSPISILNAYPIDADPKMQPSSDPPDTFLCSYEYLVHNQRERFLLLVMPIEHGIVTTFWARSRTSTLNAYPIDVDPKMHTLPVTHSNIGVRLIEVTETNYPSTSKAVGCKQDSSKVRLKVIAML